MIIARNVYFIYPNGRQALKNLTLDIKEFPTVIMGPNGSGKTTLLKILALIYKPTKGEVWVDNENYWKLPKHKQLNVRKRVVYLHEKPKLFSWSVLENVAYPLKIRGLNWEEARNEAESLLRELGIQHLKDRSRKQLSAGEAQLVAYARAAIIKPRYFLLDEPTNALDQNKRTILEDHLKKLMNEGTKIIIATHDALLAIKLAKKIVILESGQTISETTSSELLDEIQKSINVRIK